MEADSAGPERPYQCSYCPKRYLRKNNLDDHILTDHPNSDKAKVIVDYKAKHGRSKGNLIIECDICSKRFRYQSDLRNHMESHFRGKGSRVRNGPVGVPLHNSSPNFSNHPSLQKSMNQSPLTRNFSFNSPQNGFDSQQNHLPPPNSTAPRKTPYSRPSQSPRRGSVPKKPVDFMRPPETPPPISDYRTRPCLYCGKTFLTDDQLLDHEDVEAADFEAEQTEAAQAWSSGDSSGAAVYRYNNNNVTAGVNMSYKPGSTASQCMVKLPSSRPYGRRPSHYSQEIDRTDEEFGGWPPVSQQQNDFRMFPIAQQGHSTEYRNNNNSTRSITNSTAITNTNQSIYSLYNNNHTSQYTSQEHQPPGGADNWQSPPPAHEDPTIVNGFLPPPPPLPTPQFSQPALLNSQNHPQLSPFDDPCEEGKIYTLLESPEQRRTKTSLEDCSLDDVLDLSLPKHSPDEASAEETILEKVKHDNDTDKESHEADKETSLNNIPTQSHTENDTKTSNDKVAIENGTDDALNPEVKKVNPELLNNESEEKIENTNGISNNVDDNPTKDIDTSNNTNNDNYVNGNVDLISKAYKSETMESVNLYEADSNLQQDANTKEINSTIPSSNEAFAESDAKIEPKPNQITTSANYETFYVTEENGYIRNEILTIDAANLPPMPQANLTYSTADIHDEYDGLMVTTNESTTTYVPSINNSTISADAAVQESRSQSPVVLQFDDPHRLDCKYCGIVFNAPHIRKFHEAGHSNEEHAEYHGEETRLYCGWCGKTFKKAAYRILHEKGHTGELAITCPFCNRGFRWESELKSHSENCSADSPAKPRNSYSHNNYGGHRGSYDRTSGGHVSKHADKDDWIENHPSMPTGWKIRSRPRPNQEGQRFFIFLSPEGSVFYSRKAMLGHMEKTGGYSLEDLEKVRRSTKSALRGLDKSSYDSLGLSPTKKPAYESKAEGPREHTTAAAAAVTTPADNLQEWQDCSLIPGWKVRKCSNSLRLEFLAPDHRLVTSIAEAMALMKNPPPTFAAASNAAENGGKKAPPPQEDAKDEEIRARLEQMEGGEKIGGANNPRKISVPLNMIHSDEGYENNVEELKTVMTRRQRDSYRKAKSAAIDKLSAVTEDLKKEIEKEEEEKIAVNSDGRSRRNKQRQNYEEMNDEDFNSLLPKPKFLIQQLNTPPPVAAATSTTPAAVTNSNSGVVTYGVNGRIPSMRVKERNRMTDQELALMEKWFSMNPYPTAEDRDLIAEMMEMPEKKVRVWFQNKRYKTEDGRMKCHFAKNGPPPPVNNSSADSCSSTTSIPAIANVTSNSNVADGGSNGALDIPATGTHVCKVCHQNFTTQTDYQIHCKRVHGTETERVVCKDCLKTFDTLWNLKTHCIEFHMGVGGNGDLYNEYQSSEINGSRSKFTRTQIITLRHSFASNPYPNKEEYRQLQENTGISNKILHSWFQNHRHREKIHSQRHHDSSFDEIPDSFLASRETFLLEDIPYIKMLDEMSWMEDEDSSSRLYNPGHRKTRFTEHQRLYLQSFFQEKEYVDDDDINDISQELQLSPKVIRIWFQHAREKKKRNLPIYTKPRGAPGRPSTNPNRRPSKRPLDMFDDDFDDFMSNDSNSLIGNDDSMITSSSAGFGYHHNKDIKNGFSTSNKSEVDKLNLTEFQKVYLENFYKNIALPDQDDINYLCEHINVTQTTLKEWFNIKNKSTNNFGAETESERVCAGILNDLIGQLNLSSMTSFLATAVGSLLACSYCGKGFPDKESLKEHEKMEAIEFEKEANKFKADGGRYNGVTNAGGDDMFGSQQHDSDELSRDEFSTSGRQAEDDPFTATSFDFFNDNSMDGDDGGISPFDVWLQEEQKRFDGNNFQSLANIWQSMSEFERMPYIEEARRLNEANPGSKKSAGGYGDEWNTPSGRLTRKNHAAKTYICKRCQVGFSTKGNLFKHLRNFHPDNPYDPRFYELDPRRKNKFSGLQRCDICNQEFVSRIGLARHRTRAHNEPDNLSGYMLDNENSSDAYDASVNSSSRYNFNEDSNQDFGGVADVSSSSDGYFNMGGDDFGGGRFEARPAHVKTKFTAYQRKALLDSFHARMKMSKVEAKDFYINLAERLDLPTKIVRIWFQNARSARKRGKPLFTD